MTGALVAKKLASVLILALKNPIKPINLLILGLLLLLSAGQPTAVAAATVTAKSTSATAAAKSARGKAISREPWLGAIVLDAATGKVLFEDQADAKGYPASVLKLMDLLIILEKIEQSSLPLRTRSPLAPKPRIPAVPACG